MAAEKAKLLTTGASRTSSSPSTASARGWLAGTSRTELAQEFVIWFGLAWPTGVSILARNMQPVVDLVFLGRLGTTELAAAGVAQMLILISSGWLWKSFGSALNTLGSQAGGAGKRRLQDTWFQIALMLTVLLCVPISVIWIFTERIMLLAQFDPLVCSLAGTFAKWYLLNLWPAFCFVMYQNHLQALGIVIPIAVVNVAMLGLNALLNYLLVFGPGSSGGLGFIGSPIATSLTAWSSLGVIAAYTHWPGTTRHQLEWSHFKAEALCPHRIRTFLGQALPTGAGNIVEDLQFTILSFLAAKLGSDAVATHNAFLNLFLAVSCLMYGAIKATIVRVGHHLGARNARMAKATAVVNFGVMGVIAVVVGTLFILLRQDLGRIFSADPAVQDLTAQIAVPIGAGYFAISVFFAGMAVLQGQGRVGVVAVAYVIGAWIVTVPAAFTLVKVANMGLLGVWTALVVGYGVITAIVAVAVLRSDWDAAVRHALQRLQSRQEAAAAAAEEGLPSDEALLSAVVPAGESAQPPSYGAMLEAEAVVDPGDGSAFQRQVTPSPRSTGAINP